MSFTLSTVPLVLLALLLWRLAKGQLLPVVMFMSVFQAASIINLKFGGTVLGLGPSYVLLLVALFRNVVGRPPKGATLHKPLRSTTTLLAIFTCYATVTAFLNPWIFSGVLFTNAKFGSHVPLQWNPGLLPQLMYLLLSILLYYVAAYRTSPAELSKALRWFVGGALMASVLAVYQYICMKTGLHFPSEYLHTNPTYGIFEAYEINGFPRMDATFTEASAAAFTFMTAFSIMLWKVLTGSASVKNLSMALGVLIGLLLTISTTGYLGLFYLVAISIPVYLRQWKGTSVMRATKILLVFPVGAIVLLMLANSGFRSSILSLLDTVVFSKTETGSYQERSQWSQDGFQTGNDTYLLGAGWGVCRASGIFPTLFGNVGVPGVICFFGAVIQVFLPILKPRGIHSQIHGAVLFSLSTVFVSLFISGTDLTAQIMWILLTMASRLAAVKTEYVAASQIRTNPVLVAG